MTTCASLLGEKMVTNRGGFYLSMFWGFALVVFFQNCAKKSGTFDIDPGKGPVVFNVKIFNSSQSAKSCFEVGQVANVLIDTVPSGRTLEYTIYKSGSRIGGAIAVSPIYSQQVFPAVGQLGDYSIVVGVREGNRTLTPRTYTFTVNPSGGCAGASCELKSLNGTNHNIGQSVQYSIKSQPTGLQAFLEVEEENYNKKAVGVTDVIVPHASLNVGSFGRVGYVKNVEGDFVRCSGAVTVTIADPAQTTPTPTPTPISTPYPSPTPTPTPTPTQNLVWNYGTSGGSGGPSCESYVNQPCSPSGNTMDCSFQYDAGGYGSGQIPYQLVCGQTSSSSATGSINISPAGGYCPIYFENSTDYPCTVTISWSAYNTPSAQLFYKEGSSLVYVGCSTSSSTQMTLGLSQVPNGSVTRTFYLFATSNCTPLISPSTASALSVSPNVIWYLEPINYDPCGGLSCGY